MKRLQESLAAAGQRLNDATGYSSIEAQKRRIEEQESIVFTAIERVSQAKDQYDASIKLRSNSQREVNELLQRKSTWIQSDLERFTTLFRSDHSNALKEEECKASLEQAELDLEKVRSKLSTMILTRYHEEQIWSDKIRRVSTWGTWALMGINIILFVFVQLALEPWKRQRLVARFEDRLRQVVQEERTLTNLLPSSEVSQNSESPA
ncbi:mitochondrial distribution and morphology family 33, partial [Protomyces lactucae-debilis]